MKAQLTVKDPSGAGHWQAGDPFLTGPFAFWPQVHPPSRHRTRAEGGNADDQGTIREIIIGAIPLEELNEKVESLLEAAE